MATELQRDLDYYAMRRDWYHDPSVPKRAGIAHSHVICVLLDERAELQQAVADVRMAADANGHGWVTTTDAWKRLEAAAHLVRTADLR